MPPQYVPIVVLFGTCAVLVAVILALSYLLGPHNPNSAKLTPYESGIVPFGTARRRFSVRFNLVAMLFILFDIEIVFLYPWAAVLRQLKVFALLEMLAFVLVLLVGYYYVWKKGAFDWD